MPLTAVFQLQANEQGGAPMDPRRAEGIYATQALCTSTCRNYYLTITTQPRRMAMSCAGFRLDVNIHSQVFPTRIPALVDAHFPLHIHTVTDLV